MTGLFETQFEEDEAPDYAIGSTGSAPAWRGVAFVRGPAQTQGSKRAFINRYTKRAVVVDDNAKELESWRGQWISAMRHSRPIKPIDQAVAVSILVYVSRPRAHFGTGKNDGVLKQNAPAVPPSGKDVDKVCRAVLDAMKIAGWVRDDSSVAELKIRRRYDEDEDGERVWVWAWTLHRVGQEEPDLTEIEESRGL